MEAERVERVMAKVPASWPPIPCWKKSPYEGEHGRACVAVTIQARRYPPGPDRFRGL